MRILKLIKNIYLMNRINSTEKQLCKYVSKFMGKNIASVGKYIESREEPTGMCLNQQCQNYKNPDYIICSNCDVPDDIGITIGDKIREMNNDELKDILVEFQLKGYYKKRMMLVQEIRDYLNEPYKDGY